MAKTKELSTQVDKEVLEQIQSSYPIENTFNRVSLPRLEFASQDVTEGKGKAMKVVVEAGTFSLSKPTDEKDENGKPVWNKEEIGKELELIVLYERKQLKFFDGESYTSSPIYDSDDQIVKLFKNKQEVDRGLPADLKARKIYKGKSAKGKDISKLEENKILYVLYEGEVYQFSIRGTSMYAFKTYKKDVIPNGVITQLNSESKENGAIAWNQITWTQTRPINKEEGKLVMEKIGEIKDAIKMEQQFFAQSNEIDAESEADKAFNALPAGK